MGVVNGKELLYIHLSLRLMSEQNIIVNMTCPLPIHSVCLYVKIGSCL